MGSDFWSIFSALSTFLGALAACVSVYIVIITVIFGYFQLKEMTTARKGEAITKMLELLSTPEVAKARRCLGIKPLPKPGEYISDDIYESMRKVWSSFNQIGMMIEFGFIKEEYVMEMYQGSIIYFWELLEPYIQLERKKRNGRYQPFFELLYKRCLIYTNINFRPKGCLSLILLETKRSKSKQ